MPAVLSSIVACLGGDSEGMQRRGELAATGLADNPHAHVAAAVSDVLASVPDDIAGRLLAGRISDTAQAMQNADIHCRNNTGQCVQRTAG